MEPTKYVFTILCYRNVDDLIACLSSINRQFIEDAYRCIVVDSFYDEDCSIRFKVVAEENGCDYLRIENKGYSYGNNVGIKYALENYAFEYLVVCNPDTEIERFDFTPDCTNAIYAPKIITLNKKSQNPMLFRRCIVADYLIYQGFLRRLTPLLYAGIGINSLIRHIGLCISAITHNSELRIYQPHGSFIIFSRSAVERLSPVFDESLFLLAEEGLLARRASLHGVKVFYCPSVEILHKEDGSMGYLGDMSEQSRESNLIAYRKIFNVEESS